MVFSTTTTKTPIEGISFRVRVFITPLHFQRLESVPWSTGAVLTDLRCCVGFSFNLSPVCNSGVDRWVEKASWMAQKSMVEPDQDILHYLPIVSGQVFDAQTEV